MGRTQKSKEQLLAEIAELRAQFARLENTEPLTDAMTDITESKLAEEAKAEIADRFQKLAEATFDVIIILDKGKVIEANKAYTKLFGYGISEVIGMDALGFVAPESKDLALKNISSGYERPYELKAKKKDGTIFSVMVCGIKSTYNGRPVRITAIQDLTERKKTEQALHESEEKFRLLVTNLPVAVWSSNPDGTDYYVSQSVEAIYGYTPEEIYQGGEKLWLSRIHPDDFNRVKDTYERLFSDGVSVNIEYRVKRKDGQWIWVADKAEIRSNGNGSQYYIGIFSDITERKEAEIKLQQSQQRLEQLTENIPGMVYKANTDWSVETITGCKEICGYTADEMNAMSKKWLSLVHPDDRDEVLKRAELTAKPYSVIQTYRILHKDGNIRWVEDHKTSRFTEEGKFVGIDGVLFDITDRKHSEESLRESERQLKEAQHIGHIGSWEWNIKTGDLKWSDEAFRMYGFQPQEFVPTFEKFAELVHDDDLAFVQEQLDASLKKNKAYNIDFRIIRSDGTIGWVHCEGKITRDDNGDPEIFFGTQADITDHKQAKEKLQENEERYRAFFEQAADSIVLFDADTGDFIEFNNKAFENLGYTREEFTKLNLSDFELPENSGEIKKHIDKIAREGSGVFETKHRKKNGQVLDILVSARVISLRGRKFVQSMWRDITERKRVERELEDYHHKMFRAEQLASLGTISATIAHELNQPLTVLQLLLQQSCRALGRKKPDIDKTIENLNDCLGEISKSITTVDRFRKFAIKSSPIDIRKVDLAKTASAVVSLLKGSAKQVKLTLSLDIDKSSLFIRGNIAEFEQVFFVVIQNAIQAADAKKARKLKVRLSSAKGQILLEFADTCGGIDPGNVDKIFEPFFTTKSGEVGTGLGLCILERIVKRYDGSLRFENRPGRGITFYIVLPMES